MKQPESSIYYAALKLHTWWVKHFCSWHPIWSLTALLFSSICDARAIFGYSHHKGTTLSHYWSRGQSQYFFSGLISSKFLLQLAQYSFTALCVVGQFSDVRSMKKDSFFRRALNSRFLALSFPTLIHHAFLRCTNLLRFANLSICPASWL